MALFYFLKVCSLSANTETNEVLGTSTILSRKRTKQNKTTPTPTQTDKQKTKPKTNKITLLFGTLSGFFMRNTRKNYESPHGFYGSYTSFLLHQKFPEELDLATSILI